MEDQESEDVATLADEETATDKEPIAKENSVEDIARKYNTYVVHAMSPQTQGGVDNLAINRATSWKERLAFLLTQQPTVSSSTIIQGDNQVPWNNMGVILSEGNIEIAFPGDTFSWVTEEGKRYYPHNTAYFEKTPVTDQIKKAILEKNGRYNELTVNHPIVAGFYIHIDREDYEDTRKMFLPNKELAEFLKSIGMPFYIFKGGQAYLGEYDERIDDFVVGEAISPTEMTTKKYEASGDALQVLQEMGTNVARKSRYNEEEVAWAINELKRIGPERADRAKAIKFLDEVTGRSERFYTDEQTGESFYMKFYPDINQARIEVLADHIYKKLGIQVPETKAMDMKGRAALVSGVIDGIHRLDPEAIHLDASVRSGFVVDAFLANWDVIGLEYDNIQEGADGKKYRIDNGGALTYRAQGEPKPYPPDIIEELDTLRDPSKNPQSARIFSDITEEEIRSQAQHLVSTLSEEYIDSLIDQSGLPASLAETVRRGMKGRRNFLIKRFSLASFI